MPREACKLTIKLGKENNQKMAALDITRHYFNSLNRKKLSEDESFSNFAKPNSPKKTTKMSYLDDSGYISPEFLPVSPFQLEGDKRRHLAATNVSIKVLLSPLKDWVEPEEENVVGKMQLRDVHHLRQHHDVPVKFSRWAFCKKLAEIFDGVNIIGKRIGRQNCDIISKLHNRNVFDFTNKLMGYLSPEDVNNMCLVSKRWLECCKASHAAQQKLKELKKSVKTCQTNKENIKMLPEKIREKPRRMTKSELFRECANTLKKDESLQKCPKCEHPAKVRPVEDRGICMNSRCGYRYCSKCRSKYHGSDVCFQVGTKRLTKEVVNTRTAKKYLRRL